MHAQSVFNMHLQVAGKVAICKNSSDIGAK